MQAEKVLSYLKKQRTPVTSEHIAQAINIPKSNVSAHLSIAAKDKRASRVGKDGGNFLWVYGPVAGALPGVKARNSPATEVDPNSFSVEDLVYQIQDALDTLLPIIRQHEQELVEYRKLREILQSIK